MKSRRRHIDYSNFQIFSDMAMLMLVTFVFLFVLILITSRVAEQEQLPKVKDALALAQETLKQAQEDNDRLTAELGDLAFTSTDAQVERVLQAAGIGKKDFDLFVEGLKSIPGKSVHMVVDATGSMHGVVNFLIPVLRVIVIRTGKELDAITWFADSAAGTFKGTMGEMLDQLMRGAPFVGSNETIGDAFVRAAENAPVPGAYILIGDEPSDDRIYYRTISAPVFTLPIGKANPSTEFEYQNLADKTGGKMLHLKFQ